MCWKHYSKIVVEWIFPFSIREMEMTSSNQHYVWMAMSMRATLYQIKMIEIKISFLFSLPLEPSFISFLNAQRKRKKHRSWFKSMHVQIDVRHCTWLCYIALQRCNVLSMKRREKEKEEGKIKNETMMTTSCRLQLHCIHFLCVLQLQQRRNEHLIPI